MPKYSWLLAEASIQLPFDKDPNELNEEEVYKYFGNLVYRR